MSYDRNHARFLLDSMRTAVELFSRPDTTHYLGLSGGKDSSACLALAEYCGIDYRPFICDVDHEKQVTYEYLRGLETFSSQSFTTLQRVTTESEFASRRDTIRKDWAQWHSPIVTE